MQHSNEVSITDSKRVPRAASADTQVPQADRYAESSRLRDAGLARSFDVNGEQRYRPLGGRPARLPVDGVRLIASWRDSRVCAHEPPRPAAKPHEDPRRLHLAALLSRASTETARNGIRLRSPQTRMGTGNSTVSEGSGAIASRAGSHCHKDQPRHRTPTRRTAPRLPTTTTWNLVIASRRSIA